MSKPEPEEARYTAREWQLYGLLDEMLTEEEARRILLSAASGAEGATEAQFAEALQWAKSARIEQELLELVLDGSLEIMFPAEGGLGFVAAKGKEKKR